MTARPKHVPLRTCVVCRASRPKAELVRWVRGAHGVALDKSGRSPGRGVYICLAEPCLRQALTRKGIERVFGGRPSPSEVESLLAGCRLSVTTA